MLTFIFGILGICFLFIVPTSVGAQCPVCIITVGGGMLIAKKLGIDDFLISIWISALNTAIAFWLAPKLKIKFFKTRPHQESNLDTYKRSGFQVQCSTIVPCGHYFV